MLTMNQTLLLTCFDSSHKLPFNIDTTSSDDHGLTKMTVAWKIQESSMGELQLTNETDWYDFHNRKI